MQAKEKVLAICYHPLYPVNFGSTVRNFQIIKHLTRRYKIYVVCPPCEVHENRIDVTLYDIAKRGIRNQLFDIHLLKFMMSLIREEDIKIIFQKDIYCGFYALLLHWITGAQLYIDEHNVEFIRLKRMGNPYWWVLKIFEKILCRFSREIFCVSELDKDLLINHLKVKEGKIKVILNGFEFNEGKYKDLDLEKIRLVNGIQTNGKAILFFGNLYYQPNIEAIRIIFDQILPRIDGKIDYKLWIMGKGELSEDVRKRPHPRVIFLGEKPDVYPYILASDLIIVPLISGGGTRIKIIESIAAGKQVLSTRLGAEGIEREGLERNLIVEDSWDEFANQVIRLLQNCPNELPIPVDFINTFRWKNIVEKIVF